jgi:hypothetical protein
LARVGIFEEEDKTKYNICGAHLRYVVAFKQPKKCALQKCERIGVHAISFERIKDMAKNQGIKLQPRAKLCRKCFYEDAPKLQVSEEIEGKIKDIPK